MDLPEEPRRPHTHSRVIGGKRYVWDVAALWGLARGLPVKEVEIGSIKEVDEDCWFLDGPRPKAPTIRRVAEHCRRIIAADMGLPVILNADGSLMDGGHRIAKALIEGRATVRAVRFERMPPPDSIEEAT